MLVGPKNNSVGFLPNNNGFFFWYIGTFLYFTAITTTLFVQRWEKVTIWRLNVMKNLKKQLLPTEGIFSVSIGYICVTLLDLEW